jgi:hypothetical protein
MWNALIQTCTSFLGTHLLQNLIRCSLVFFFFFFIFDINLKSVLRTYLCLSSSGGFEKHTDCICKVKSGYTICSRDEWNFGTTILHIQKWPWWGNGGKLMLLLSSLSERYFIIEFFVHFCGNGGCRESLHNLIHQCHCYPESITKLTK